MEHHGGKVFGWVNKQSKMKYVSPLWFQK
jgi:hypothetical protein